MKLLVKDCAKNKTVLIGEIRGDTLIKIVEQKKHFMSNENGYGINADGMMMMVKRGVKTIRIVETDTGTTFEVPVQVWDDVGKLANYGHGPQIFLSMKYYKLVNKETDQADYTEEGMKKLHDAMAQVFGKKLPIQTKIV